jgi:hypothetical protein
MKINSKSLENLAKVLVLPLALIVSGCPDIQRNKEYTPPRRYSVGPVTHHELGLPPPKKNIHNNYSSYSNND